MIVKTTLFTLAAFAVLGGGGAQAAPPVGYSADSDIVAVIVPTTGLNLRSEHGAQVALQRVHNAAHEVCGVQPDIRDIGPYEAYDACLKTTVDRAVVTSGSPTMALLNGAASAPTQFAARSH